MSEWGWPAATVFATLFGPILAVQAQKWVERARERKQLKLWVFRQLMATRANRISAEHVQALNMIDFAFYGRRLFGHYLPTKTETAVTDAWHEYLDHLNTPQEDGVAWTAQSTELLANTLSAMAKDLGYSFDRVRLKKGAYLPMAHGAHEQQTRELRSALAEVLAGGRSIKMEVTGFPFSQEATDAQVKLQGKLADALGGDGALRITMVNGTNKGDGKTDNSAASDT